MWALWRVHDVFEEGTEPDAYPQGGPQQARVLCRMGRSHGDGDPGGRAAAHEWHGTHAGAGPSGRYSTEVEVCQGDQSNPTNCISNLRQRVSGSTIIPAFPFLHPALGFPAEPSPMDFAQALLD